jgi:hypothetical protein
MTTLTLPRLARLSPRFTAIARSITEVLAGIRDGHEIARRYDELSRLSDEALARRGLTRAEIPQAAVTGRGMA